MQDQDRELERQTKRKTLRYTFAFGAFFLLFASWYATQNVAELCNYSPALGFNVRHIYFPWQYFVWVNNSQIASLIPQILEAQEKWFYIALYACFPVGYLIRKSLIVNTSHGSAGWAQKEDIDESGLGQYEEDGKTVKNSGVVVGINPYSDTLMMHNGKEHILLMAPTRSGKGVNTIIPTGLIWRNSIFFVDVKNELWNFTSRYRRDVFGQKVMKFEPLCADGSSVRWNPLAEVDFQTSREINDVSTIVEIIVRPDGKKGGDDFWPDSAAKLLKGMIIHLLYAHYQEGKPLPCLTDVMSLLSSPDKSLQELFEGMKLYPHISPEDFMSGHNVLYEIYGEYIKDWRSFNKTLSKWFMPPVHTIEEAREAIRSHLETVGKKNLQNDVDWADPPFCYLLTHPKVAECAADMLKGAEQTTASIMQTAQTAMALYQNPVVQKNTAVSDFMMRDLLNPAQAVSLYLCIAPNDVQTVKPLSRLFINTMLAKLIRDMKFDDSGKQRLLLMLDEFPQLGNMQSIELALAVCAGYGIKMCIVAQDVNQLNKEYTQNNSISSNCHIHIYFTPNLDNGGATAEAISKALGKHTISTVSHSDGGGGWFKGSDSTSFTSRELMTPDEVSRLSPRKEIVFVAGHKPILGKKLFYFEHEWLDKRTKLKPPLYSDTLTSITSYDELFRVHAAERKDLEERTAEVREGKAFFQLDCAKDEKLRAVAAVKEAKEQLASMQKETAAAQESKRDLEAAKSRLAVAENTAKLADARVKVQELQYRLVTLGNLLSKAQAKKSAVSGYSDDSLSAGFDLLEAQRNLDEAKKQLKTELANEAKIHQTVDADNRQIQARMLLMAALDKLNSTKETTAPILREEEERRRQYDAAHEKPMDISAREREARHLLDMAAAAKDSAEREYDEAAAAYKNVLENIKRQKAEEKQPKEAEEQKDSPESQKKTEEHESGNDNSADNVNSGGEAEFDETWEMEAFGGDPVAEEVDDSELDGSVREEEEGESENGADDEGTTGGGVQAERVVENNSAADRNNGEKAFVDESRCTSQEQEEIDIPEDPEAAAMALSERIIRKPQAQDDQSEKWKIRHRPADVSPNGSQRGGGT